MDDQQWAARQWEKAALHEAQVAFDAALNRLARGGPRALRAFRTWAGDRLDDMCSEVPFLLREVVEALRPHVPINQHAPDELIVYPTTGENADCEADRTLQVDAFVYDEDEVDCLVEKGQLSRAYCLQCQSDETKPYVMISHSLSVAQLQFIFQQLLPQDLSDTTVLDVGSRLGAVLFGGYTLSNTKRLMGIEKQQHYCNIQRDIIATFKMEDRIELFEGDILDHAAVFEVADIVILNNVFEFFASTTEQQQLWGFLAKALNRPNVTVVSNPPLQQALGTAGIDFDWEWLHEVPIDAILCPTDDDTESFHLYQTRRE